MRSVNSPATCPNSELSDCPSREAAECRAIVSLITARTLGNCRRRCLSDRVRAQGGRAQRASLMYLAVRRSQNRHHAKTLRKPTVLRRPESRPSSASEQSAAGSVVLVKFGQIRRFVTVVTKFRVKKNCTTLPDMTIYGNYRPLRTT